MVASGVLSVSLAHAPPMAYFGLIFCKMVVYVAVILDVHYESVLMGWIRLAGAFCRRVQVGITPSLVPPQKTSNIEKVLLLTMHTFQSSQVIHDPHL